MTAERVLQGTGSGYQDKFILPGASGLLISVGGVVIGTASTLNFGDGTTPPPFNATDAGGIITLDLFEPVLSTTDVDAGALIKCSGNGTYDMLGAGDNPRLMRGIAVTGVTGAGIFIACFIPGIAINCLNDGTGTISSTGVVIPSTTVAGRVMEGSLTDVFVGINVGAAVAAVLDDPVLTR